MCSSSCLYIGSPKYFFPMSDLSEFLTSITFITYSSSGMAMEEIKLPSLISGQSYGCKTCIEAHYYVIYRQILLISANQ